MDKEQNFAIRPSKACGGGLGAFATRDFVVGEVVFEERPAMLIDRSGAITYKISSTTESFSEEAARKKADEVQQRVMLLEDCTLSSSPKKKGEKTLSGIVMTNAYEAGASDVGGLFPLISRFNHRCHPNLNHYWSSKDQLLCLRAIQPISKGQELFTCYVDPRGTYAERQADLFKRYRFRCKCPGLCALDADARARNDSERRLWAALDRQIPESRNVGEALARCEFLLKLLRRIGHLPAIARVLYDRFQIKLKNAGSMKDPQLREWAKEAHDAMIRVRGREDALEPGNPTDDALRALAEPREDNGGRLCE